MIDSTPTTYAKHLATYIIDPYTIWKLTQYYFARGPSLEKCTAYRTAYCNKRGIRVAPVKWGKWSCGHERGGDNLSMSAAGRDKCRECAKNKAEATRASDRARKLRAAQRRLDKKPVATVTHFQHDPTAPALLNTIAEAFAITPADIMGPRRGQHYVDARAVAVVVLRTRGLTFTRIAPYIGRTDYSTAKNLFETFDVRARQRPLMLQTLQAAQAMNTEGEE